MDRDFTIVFEKLEEARGAADAFDLQQSVSTELDELAELRRIVVEISEPEPLSYTTT
jgi:hypothetical protein